VVKYKSFVCDQCGDKCLSDRSEDDCQKESDELWPGEVKSDMAQVCEECYIKTMSFYFGNQGKWTKWTRKN
jgi:hypothetical protein